MKCQFNYQFIAEACNTFQTVLVYCRRLNVQKYIVMIWKGTEKRYLEIINNFEKEVGTI